MQFFLDPYLKSRFQEDLILFLFLSITLETLSPMLNYSYELKVFSEIYLIFLLEFASEFQFKYLQMQKHFIVANPIDQILISHQDLNYLKFLIIL